MENSKLKRIVLVNYPINLLISIALFGPNNEFILVTEDSNSARHKGRNLALKRQLCEKLLDALACKYRIVHIKDLSFNYDSCFNEIVVDSTVSSAVLRAIKQSNKDLRKVSTCILSFGADNLLPFASISLDQISIRAFNERRAWSKFYKDNNVNTLVTLGRNRFNALDFHSTKLLNITYQDLLKYQEIISTKILFKYFPSFQLEESTKLIIISLDDMTSDRNLISDVVAHVNALTKENASYDLLIKPHPASTIVDEMIEAIESATGLVSINTTMSLDSELLKAMPLEFFILHHQNSHYVGTISSAIALLDTNSVSLCKSHVPGINKKLKRSYSSFLKLNGLKYPN
jgi:hypothetical protein